eukprot:9470331-Pyramimonas_sp.AAC.1
MAKPEARPEDHLRTAAKAAAAKLSASAFRSGPEHEREPVQEARLSGAWTVVHSSRACLPCWHLQ